MMVKILFWVIFKILNNDLHFDFCCVFVCVMTVLLIRHINVLIRNIWNSL